MVSVRCGDILCALSPTQWIDMINAKDRFLFGLAVLHVITLTLVLLMFFQSRAQPTHSLFIGAGGSVTDSTAPELTPAELEQALRAIVRSELASRTGNVTQQAASTAAPTAETRELQLHAAETSATIIRQATAAGVWSREDTEALLPHIGQVSADQRLALVEQFYTAINRQELELEDFPPL
jgi:hypothetical protein